MRSCFGVRFTCFLPRDAFLDTARRPASPAHHRSHQQQLLDLTRQRHTHRQCRTGLLGQCPATQSRCSLSRLSSNEPPRRTRHVRGLERPARPQLDQHSVAHCSPPRSSMTRVCASGVPPLRSSALPSRASNPARHPNAASRSVRLDHAAASTNRSIDPHSVRVTIANQSPHGKTSLHISWGYVRVSIQPRRSSNPPRLTARPCISSMVTAARTTPGSSPVASTSSSALMGRSSAARIAFPSAFSPITGSA